MVYTSMSDLLEAELQECLCKGTHVKDAGFTVSIKPLKNEKICFFLTDSKSARAYMQMDDQETKSCDYLVIYTKQDQSKKELLCFLELKGKDISHAVKQICNTYRHILKLIEQLLLRQQHQYILYSASICMHGTTPNGKALAREESNLRKLFGKNIHIKHVRPGCSSYSELREKLSKFYTGDQTT